MKKKKLEKEIFTKNIEIKLDKDWRKSKVIIDGKMLPFMELEIKQGKSTDGILECKLVVFPNKVIWIK